MDDDREDDEAIAQDGPIAHVRATLARTATRLADAGARQETLAEMVTPRRLFFISRPPVLVRAGTVWHLGVFLLARDATLYEAGATTRAIPPGRPNYHSSSAEESRQHRAAAVRGGFSPDETITFGAVRIDLSEQSLTAGSGRLFLHEGQPLVRWTADSTPASSVPLEDYLRDRAELLLHPQSST